jgi:hypothetical protein
MLRGLELRYSLINVAINLAINSAIVLLVAVVSDQRF